MTGEGRKRPARTGGQVDMSVHPYVPSALPVERGYRVLEVGHGCAVGLVGLRPDRPSPRFPPRP